MEAEEVTCPEGNKSIYWSLRVKGGKHQIKVRFSSMDCRVCPSKDLCIRSKAENKHRNPVRELTLVSRENHEALKLAREREKTPQYAQEYSYREGVEGTVSRAVRTCGLRRTRYRGLQKVHLGHIVIAAAMNFVRVGEWFSGTPRAPARLSPFVGLMGREVAA